MSVLDTPPPCFDTEVAKEMLDFHFGINGELRRLDSERDQNFLVIADNSNSYVLKIANTAEDISLLEMQNAALRHIETVAPGLDVPRIVGTRNGGDLAEIEASDGSRHVVRLVTYLSGQLFKDVEHSDPVLSALGEFLARVDLALQGFIHSAAIRDFSWDLRHAAKLRLDVTEIQNPRHRQIVEQHFNRFESEIKPRLPKLRSQIIHNDGNDHNLIVGAGNAEETFGIIDFGDMTHTCLVFELAVALAYAMMNKSDPLAAAAQIVSAYHSRNSLTEQEADVLFDLVIMRLCMSVTIAARRYAQYPDNQYILVSQDGAWDLLTRFKVTDLPIGRAVIRSACGYPALPNSHVIVQWLASNKSYFAPILGKDLKRTQNTVFRLTGEDSRLDADIVNGDVHVFQDVLDKITRQDGAEIGLGLYGEDRVVYTGDSFASELITDQRRTVHLGFDLFQPAATPVHAPLDGFVESIVDNAVLKDYGPTVILRHGGDGVPPFFTLYGHLSKRTLDHLKRHQEVKRGNIIGWLGAPDENVGWPPHLHFQIVCDLLGHEGNFPGVCERGLASIWKEVSPDPNLILSIPEEALSYQTDTTGSVKKRRDRHLGPSLSLSYDKPLKIIRGEGVNLIDETGRAYLDMVNNVCHVGHCHPAVVDAIQTQAALLNTNTRYLHDTIVRLSEALTATLPEPLNVCFFVCSGSEANELALRLAKAHTGRTGVVVIDGAYHGNTSALVDLSPYKFDGPGGDGMQHHVRKVLMPDPYRGEYRSPEPGIGPRYARDVEVAVNDLASSDLGPAAFIAESLLGCGGQIVLPDDYLDEAFGHARRSGAVCIADEVQVGFGRVGAHMWGFESQNVVPDIVTFGKPFGNGHPLAAVVTTPEIARDFANGMEYFNTFGGNPVSCAAGLAVLNVIEEENLQANALATGNLIMDGARDLQEKFEFIGNVRGLGLYIGIELVKDRVTLEPAADEASLIVNRMRDLGILLSTDGPLHNVIKIKPPIVFSHSNVDLFLDRFEQVMQAL